MPRFFVRTQGKPKVMAFAATVMAGAYSSRSEPHILIADLKQDDVARLRDQGAQVIASHQYQPVASE